MLTQDQVLSAIRGGRKSRCLDRRDFARLIDFFPVSDLEVFGFTLKEGVEVPDPKPWTEEEVRAQMARDLAFAFEKAHDQRGISASFMYEVVKMWMWVLEDELQDFNDYAPYGLPLLRAVAQKYGLTEQAE